MGQFSVEICPEVGQFSMKLNTNTSELTAKAPDGPRSIAYLLATDRQDHDGSGSFRQGEANKPWVIVIRFCAPLCPFCAPEPFAWLCNAHRISSN
jgi:hypothetical protein